jgi:hypothetical protein
MTELHRDLFARVIRLVEALEDNEIDFALHVAEDLAADLLQLVSSEEVA